MATSQTACHKLALRHKAKTAPSAHLFCQMESDIRDHHAKRQCFMRIFSSAFSRFVSRKRRISGDEHVNRLHQPPDERRVGWHRKCVFQHFHHRNYARRLIFNSLIGAPASRRFDSKNATPPPVSTVAVRNLPPDQSTPYCLHTQQKTGNQFAALLLTAVEEFGVAG